MKGKLIQLKLVRSTNKCTRNQKLSAIGLGLRKLGAVRSLKNTPEVRGMIKRIIHLIKVTE